MILLLVETAVKMSGVRTPNRMQADMVVDQNSVPKVNAIECNFLYIFPSRPTGTIGD